MMPSPRTHRRVNEDNPRKGIRLSEKSKSFHGQSSGTNTPDLLRRPRTVPDLLAGGRNSTGESTAVNIRPLKLTKLLLNVTIQRSVGPVQVLISLESTVDDLIAAALRQYSKEGRRPVLSSVNAGYYDLHYSQFSLESLDRTENLNALGSRNFFMCPKNGSTTTTSSLSCGKQSDTTTKISLPWLKFMDFLL
ncbi:putative bifunctional polymyxin resistance protein ArnA-like [Capsicum annuum]|uniref:DUF7054 domain-containing protein n=1 Tax=Capsicum annuum TaxID=4072 RepID=A0A1U8FAD2_CAPAN|nr:uncharacterized protein At4g22758 [Capsicum annuum]KAF3630202.1 putative bifunctional polymyxin resistance protein ArnA-like [Capsicum annuum]KAF3684673.1 putative bifunctional polymyxin resistance protein ArnA-like [Capsicum annuum]PHT94420.1 hypothetical protein T459_02302 [Capsicum annuum]